MLSLIEKNFKVSIKIFSIKMVSMDEQMKSLSIDCVNMKQEKVLELECKISGVKILQTEQHRRRGRKEDTWPWTKIYKKYNLKNREYKAYIINRALGTCQVTSSLGCRRNGPRGRAGEQSQQSKPRRMEVQNLLYTSAQNTTLQMKEEWENSSSINKEEIEVMKTMKGQDSWLTIHQKPWATRQWKCLPTQNVKLIHPSKDETKETAIKKNRNVIKYRLWYKKC